MKTIQFIIEAAILLTLIIVCVLLAGKRTVAVDGDVQLSHSQVSDIVDAIEGEGGGEKIDKVQMGQLIGSSVKIDKAQMAQLVEAIKKGAEGEAPKWKYRVRLIDSQDRVDEKEDAIELWCDNGWEFFETSRHQSDRFVTTYYRKRIK